MKRLSKEECDELIKMRGDKALEYLQLLDFYIVEAVSFAIHQRVIGMQSNIRKIAKQAESHGEGYDKLTFLSGFFTGHLALGKNLPEEEIREKIETMGKAIGRGTVLQNPTIVADAHYLLGLYREHFPGESAQE